MFHTKDFWRVTKHRIKEVVLPKGSLKPQKSKPYGTLVLWGFYFSILMSFLGLFLLYQIKHKNICVKICPFFNFVVIFSEMWSCSLCFQIALNKPSGLQVLPGGLFQQRTVLTQLQWWAKKKNRSPACQESHPVPVHRLGRGTSGQCFELCELIETNL